MQRTYLRARSRRRRGWNRLVLHRVTRARVDHGAQLVAAAQRVRVDQAALRLRNCLAGVEQRGRWINAARVGIELGAGQAQRVIGLDLDPVRDQRQLTAACQRQIQARIAQRAVGGAVVAVAVG